MTVTGTPKWLCAVVNPPADHSPSSLDAWLRNNGINTEPLIKKDSLLIQIATGPRDESLAHLRFRATWQQHFNKSVGSPFPTGEVTNALGRPKSDAAIISRIIKGRSLPTDEDWEKCSRITACSLTWLYRGIEPIPGWIAPYYEAVQRARDFLALAVQLSSMGCPTPVSTKLADWVGFLADNTQTKDAPWLPNVAMVLEQVVKAPRHLPLKVEMASERWSDLQRIIPIILQQMEMCPSIAPRQHRWVQVASELLAEIDAAIDLARLKQRPGKTLSRRRR